MSAASEYDHDWIMARVEEFRAMGETEPRLARDPVNQPMINNWLEAMGEHNPIYRPTDEAERINGGPVAPTAMAQVWTMYGLDPTRPDDDPLHGTMAMFDQAGFTSVLGTNCDQTYERYLRPGEQVAITTRLESVVGPKRTGVGEGYFVTTVNTWWVGEEKVATMLFRVLKYKPGARRPAVDRTKTVRPVINRDNAYFFEGTALGELRIQRCAVCGALRHPPGPMCPQCHATQREHIVASGRGRIHSWLVHHAPQVPGKQLPLPLALVELEEGVRMVGAVEGATADDLSIGADVQVVFDEIDEDLTLASWRLVGSQNDGDGGSTSPAEAQPSADEHSAPVGPDVLPDWQLPITPTLVVSTAISTRDFQDVHHDRDLAIQRGSKDIFLNILTSTGLVQRYVSEWAGPEAVIRGCTLRLGAPAYPYDSLQFSGRALSIDGTTAEVEVIGAVSLGEHVRSTVTVELPTPLAEQVSAALAARQEETR